ncbi:MAG: transcriptional repressor [Chitinophagales bacterium]
MEVAEDFLRAQSLRITPARLAVLNHFVQESQVLSHADLESALGKQFDRVTIYRTLNTFLEKDIVHKVPGEEHSTKFALNSHSNASKSKSVDAGHAHFKCNDCGKLLCLHGVKIQNGELPQGFEMESSNIILSGTCSECNR